jgi:hypothetical protein
MGGVEVFDGGVWVDSEQADEVDWVGGVFDLVEDAV